MDMVPVTQMHHCFKEPIHRQWSAKNIGCTEDIVKVCRNTPGFGNAWRHVLHVGKVAVGEAIEIFANASVSGTRVAHCRVTLFIPQMISGAQGTHDSIAIFTVQ